MTQERIQHYLPSLFQRGISFINRARWVRSLTGGVSAAVITLVSIRRDRDAIQSVSYAGSPVKFRGHDEQALREVLVDQEYGFLTGLLSGISAPTILDVGAHIGTFAIWVFGVNSNSRVLSVEANPSTYQVAKLNSTATAKGRAKWQVIHGAAGAKDGEILFLSDTGPTMSHYICREGTVKVRCVSLTALIDRIAPGGLSIDLVKIDIEGSEEAFLFATPDALKRVDCLVIELHPQLCNSDQVRLLLEKYFDRIEEIDGRKSTKPLLYCRRTITAQAA